MAGSSAPRPEQSAPSSDVAAANGGSVPAPAAPVGVIFIPTGTRRLLAAILMQSGAGSSQLQAFAADHEVPASAGMTLVIDAAHLEPVPVAPARG
jgi:hypothetical protein